MLIESVGAALASKTRVDILKILSHKPASLIEIFNELNRSGVNVKYRTTVYRALQKLVLADLVEKTYDPELKGIHYKILKTHLMINLMDGTVR